MLDDKDEFGPHGGLVNEVREALMCNLGSALYTNVNLMAMYLKYRRESRPDLIKKLRDFYAKYKDDLDMYWTGDPENWFERQLAAARSEDHYPLKDEHVA